MDPVTYLYGLHKVIETSNGNSLTKNIRKYTTTLKPKNYNSRYAGNVLCDLFKMDEKGVQKLLNSASVMDQYAYTSEEDNIPSEMNQVMLSVSSDEDSVNEDSINEDAVNEDAVPQHSKRTIDLAKYFLSHIGTNKFKGFHIPLSAYQIALEELYLKK